MKLSICIVNYNSGELLRNCLKSLDQHPPSVDFEVIVVDNNSQDQSQKACEVNISGRQVHLIQNTYNKGFAYANNQAFDVAQGDYLLLLNADTEVTPNALDTLIDCAESDSLIGLCTARLVNQDGSTQIGFNVRRLPTLISMAAQLLLLDELWPQNPVSRRYYCLDFDYSQFQDVEQPAASALLLNRRTLLSVGGFDPQFTNWFNDVDLCVRVLKAGWRNVYCPSSVVVHHGGMGSASRTAMDVMIEMYRSQRAFVRKHHGYVAYLFVTFLILIGMVMRLVVLTLLPNGSKATQLHVRSSGRRDMLEAYRAVLVDTLHTWVSLKTPCSYSG